MPPILSIGIERGEGVGVRMHNEIMRAVLHSVALHHLTKNIPKHFEDRPETAPGGGYKYRKRSKKWLAIKKRVYGNMPANVASGELKANVLSRSRITATKDRARIYLKSGRPLPAWQRAEIEAITPGEFREWKQLAQRLYVEEFKARRKRGSRTRTTV